MSGSIRSLPILQRFDVSTMRFKIDFAGMPSRCQLFCGRVHGGARQEGGQVR